MVSYKVLIGKKIQVRRVEMGFQTQDDMAKKLGTTQSQVSRWEGGINLPEGELKKAIAEILKVDHSFFELVDLKGEIVNYNISDVDLNKLAQNAAEKAIEKQNPRDDKQITDDEFKLIETIRKHNDPKLFEKIDIVMRLMPESVFDAIDAIDTLGQPRLSRRSKKRVEHSSHKTPKKTEG